jgi:osmotically-inducible protein OsmY
METIIAVSFDDRNRPYDAVTKLEELDQQGQLSMYEGVVERDLTGSWSSRTAFKGATTTAESRRCLRGTVSSLKHRRAAVVAARSVGDVDEVYDVLKVPRVPGDPRDHKLLGTVLQSLISDSRVPEDEVDVDVAAARVTLRGQASAANGRPRQ